MQALRLNEVLMRVVAWHNRHPLARRITAAQVHSIGEVVLPFASALTLPPPPAAPALPALHDLLDPPDSHPDSKPVEPAVADADPAQAQPDLPAEPAHPEVSLDPSDPHPLDGQGEAGIANTPGPADTVASEEPATELAPVLSMEDEADNLFSNDPASRAEAPGGGTDTGPAAADDDDDGPEMLIELSSDPDEPPGAPPDLPPHRPPDTPAIDADALLPASDAASADLAAAFAAATADAPLPARGADAPDEHSAAAEALAPASVPPAPDPDPDPDPAEPATLSVAVPAEPAAAPGAETSASDPALPGHPGAAAVASAAPTAPANRTRLARLRAWWQSLRRPGSGAQGLPRLTATFSRDFIWPLRPAQVARWAQRHGSLQTLAPPDWPQRRIDVDDHLQTQARSKGLAHALPLHLLTAAIGVGDRRIRVLMDAQGRILGPRSYSPPKLGGLAGVAALGLLGAGWGWLPRADSISPQQVSAVVAAAAQAASAAALAAAAASAVEWVWRAQQAESNLPGTAAADAPASDALHAAKPAADHSSHSAAAPAPHSDAATASAHDTDAAEANTASVAASTQAPAEPTAPAAITSTATTFALPTLEAVQPALSPAARQTARQQAQALRSEKSAAAAAAPRAAPAIVYAIVTRPTREKESAARSLALIRASRNRLDGDAPEHGELMRNQGEWRAAWWPFESQADAERARVMLAARGVKAEVVEF